MIKEKMSNFIKKIQTLLVNFYLFLIYFSGIGMTKLIMIIFFKKYKYKIIQSDSFWKDVQDSYDMSFNKIEGQS